MTGKRPQHRLPGAEPYIPTNIFDAMLVFGEETDFTPEVKNYFDPTDAPPGSLEKIAILARRAELGLPLWHPKDRVNFEGWNRPVPEYLLAKDNLDE